jgi:two-component system, OmpR family, sensor kinase
MSLSALRVPRLQTANRLSALRLRLVVLFTVLSLAGLSGMAVVGIVVDAQQREQALLADLRITSGAVLSLIYREAGTLRMTGIADAIGTRATGVYVFEKRGNTLGPALARPGRTTSVPTERLEPAARTSISTRSEVAAKVMASDGTVQQLLAVAFEVESAAQPAGAVVVTVDAQSSEAAHRRLTLALIGGSVGFSLLSGLGGFLLARRSTRAVELALDQQERFLADAAHELRTPLTTIRINAEAAVADPGGGPAQMRSVLRSAQRLGVSVDTLLTRARLMAGTQPLQLLHFRLDQLVSEVVDETVLPPHSATTELPATVCFGDPAVLRIAVRNLVENAVRHGTSGDHPARLVVSVGPDQVTVRDYGPGLPDGADLRDRFQSGGRGSGLGLAIVDWAVQLHKGQLELANEPDGGLVARIRLPAGAGTPTS